jgi:methylmalonyl-CoA/ethylmalonyl-CoA epimerase
MKVDHIGVAVSSLRESKAFYEALGLVCGGEEEVPEQRVKVAFFPAGESRIELLESTDPEGPIGRFLAKKGPGLHHVCLAVPDVRAAMEALKARGYALIDQEPKTGAGGHLVAFVHPKSTGGVLLELSQQLGEGK